MVLYPGIQPGLTLAPTAAEILPPALRSILSATSFTNSTTAPASTDPPEWWVSNNTQRNATAWGGAYEDDGPTCDQGHNVRFQDISDTRHARPPVAGRGRDEVPAVLNGPGSGAGGFMQPARNPYGHPVIFDSDRVRHRESDESREREMQTALQMDIDIANNRTAQCNMARDARNGVNVVSGRGNWPPPTTTPTLTEATR